MQISYNSLLPRYYLIPCYHPICLYILNSYKRHINVYFYQHLQIAHVKLTILLLLNSSQDLFTLNTWNGRSYFQEVCFQRQQDRKGCIAAWGAKCSEFRCHLDPGDPFAPFPQLQKHCESHYPCILVDMKRKPCNSTEWRSLGKGSLWKTVNGEAKKWTLFPSYQGFMTTTMLRFQLFIKKRT